VSYLDSGYIVKFYVDEPDSPRVRQLAESSGEVHCAALGRAEVAAALHRKLREGVFSEAAFREVIAQFEDDCSSDLWTWIPLTATSGFTEVYTADRHMALAAPHFSVRPVTVRPS